MRARDSLAWNHTAVILCSLHNTHCTRTSQLIKDPSQFHPYHHDSTKAMDLDPRESVDHLKALLLS